MSDDPNPATAFAAVVALRRQADQLERDAVAHALSAGWTWADIGHALGVSGQAAHKRFGPGRSSAKKTRGTR
ncbi:hypothetical protein [Rhodococcus jostii]|uniref:hypothetical protein n=1 Tax=Rhodococcus jostii TaxID=132919 RepID=UPI00031FF110|nr:hypothetical protein [Rhodococcus jostii]